MTNIIRIQYTSNLFLGNSRLRSFKPILKPNAPILALLGNIGDAQCPKTKDFFQWAETKYQRIYWIPGALEYASSGNGIMSWQKKSELYYSSIQGWGLKKTSFCQKFAFNLSPSLQILATAAWHPHFDYKTDQNVHSWKQKMSKKEFTTLQVDEVDWILKNSERLSKPTILLTHSPVPLPSEYILCNLYGTEHTGQLVSYSGGINPWVGVNMFGSMQYRKDAFMEWVDPKSD
jgi:hypothetical protein